MPRDATKPSSSQETRTRDVRNEREADVWLDHLANTCGLVGASFTQLGGGRLRVTARLAPQAAALPNPGAAGSPTEVTSPDAAAEQDTVTSPEQLTLGW